MEGRERQACPPEEQLVALVEGRLDEAEAARAHSHLRGCDDCRLLLAGLGDEAESLPTEPLAEPTPRKGPPVADAPAAAGEKKLAPGDSVGRFVLRRLVGVGGMGEVWAARDPELGRAVALKLLRPGAGGDSDGGQGRRRLLREAKAMANLAHPNVVPVFEVGVEPGEPGSAPEEAERLFVVMELVEGETLRKWLERPRKLGEILGAFIAAGEGLAAAHAAGIVHRDFKPDNVLMGKDGRPRVTDFGLARTPRGLTESLSQRSATAAEMLATPSTLTPIGALLGTPAYMAPEQLRGGQADARSDIFSFCTALYEAVAGTRPYPGQSAEEVCRRAEEEELERPLPGRHLPLWLRRELQRGLRVTPLRRHASMDELLQALERGRSRRPARWVLSGLGALALVLLALLAARPRGQEPRRAVAVLGPREELQGSGPAWLSGALGELLYTELLADAQLRLIAPERVDAALSDLGLSRTALGAEAAHKLQRRLGADLILGGTVREEAGKLRVQLAVYGAGDRPVAQAEESGTQAALAELAARLGKPLRRALGGGDAPGPGRVQSSFPEDAEAARLYVLGVSQLHGHEPGAAVGSLRNAAQLLPDNPRIELALAEALLELSYEAPAREAARLAMRHREELPPEDRARLEILYQRALRDREQALALARAFYAQAPDDLERGLSLARLQHTLLRDEPGALATLAELRKLPKPSGDDPRIDVLAAPSLIGMGKLQEAVATARRAGEAARLLGARREQGLAAYYEGVSLRRLGTDPAGAAKVLQRAEETLIQVNDLGNATGAQTMQAAILADAGDLAGAREKMEAALATSRKVGDRHGEGAALHNLSIIERRLRDLPAAIQRSQMAQAVFVELGDRSSIANSLATLGNLRMDVGDLEGAAAALSESAGVRRELKDPLLISSLTSLTDVRLLQGDLAVARKTLEEARAAGAGQEKQHAWQLREAEAKVALAEGKPAESEAAARDDARLAAEAKQVDAGAMAQAMLARALLVQGRVPEARQAVTQGTALLGASKTALARAQLTIMDGRVKAAESPRTLLPAVQLLRGALDDSIKAGVAADQWEARLALAECEPAESRAVVRARLRRVGREARAQGFGLFALYADAAAGR